MSLTVKPKWISPDMTDDTELAAETSAREGADSALSTSLSDHVNNVSNPHLVTKAQVGLANVDNVSAASLRDRSTHTGSQLASTISDFTTAVQAVTIDASKIDGGNVSNTEFSYLDGVTSSIQTQINGKEPSITAGVASQYWRGDKSFQTLDKTAVGLSNVDNTADANKTIAGDVTGTLSSSTVTKLQNRALSSAAPATDQVIKWNGSQWTPSYVTTWTSNTVANSTLSLTSTSSRGQIFTGTVGGQTVNMPDATTLAVGEQFTFINASDPLVIIRDSAATYKATTLPSRKITATLISNSTAAGSWIFEDTTLELSDYELYDDFVSANVTTNQIGALGWTIATGTTAYQTSTGASTGVIRVNTATANNSVGAMSLGTTAPVLINNSYTFMESRFSLPSLGGAGANQLSMQLGLQTLATVTAPGATVPLSAIGFHFDGSTGTPGAITAFASSATTSTTSASAITPVAGTFYKVSMIINAAGTSAYYYINNAYFATISTNMPTAIVMGPMVKVNAGGTNAAAKSVDVDFYRLQKIYSTPR